MPERTMQTTAEEPLGEQLAENGARVVAIFPFEGEQEEELKHVQTGDVLTVIEWDVGAGWMHVEQMTAEGPQDGLIPASYALFTFSSLLGFAAQRCQVCAIGGINMSILTSSRLSVLNEPFHRLVNG